MTNKPEMAFPQAECGPSGGVTTRDLFAALALVGILAGAFGPRVAEVADESGIEPEDCLASAAYDYADAMLRARK